VEEFEMAIRELQGNPFDASAKPTGKALKAAEVKFLAPAEPKKVVAARCRRLSTWRLPIANPGSHPASLRH
jgi:hypothetical protein